MAENEGPKSTEKIGEIPVTSNLDAIPDWGPTNTETITLSELVEPLEEEDEEEEEDKVEFESENLSDGEQQELDPMGALLEQLDEQRRRVTQAERAVTIRRQRLTINREKRERISRNLAHLTASRDSLGSWLHERSQSLALKMLAYVDAQENLLKAEEKGIRAWAEVPIPSSSETSLQLRRRYVKNLWLSFFGAIVIPLVLFGINSLLMESGRDLYWLDGIWWRYAIVGFVILVLFVFGALTSYHRGYIRMKVDMDVRLAHGRYLLGAIEHIRMERARLEGLTPQLRDRLQFFGSVLQEPWRVPGFGSNVDDSERLNRGLPALLQIAKTAHSNDPTIIKLRAQFTAEQYRIGMRRKAIDNLIRVAADKRGIPSEQADLRVIDRDSATYGLRAALQDMVRDPEVLETVGRARVTEIASHIQSGMTPSGERPGIARTNIDTLQGLRVNHDLLAHWSTEQMSWDEYVVEILEDGAALSRLAFSPMGTAQSRHLKFQSIAVAPARLHEQAGQLIEFVEVDSGVVTGTEIIARIDITPPVDVSEVALFENRVEEQWNADASESKSGDSAELYDDETL